MAHPAARASHIDAQDATQEAFVRIFRNFRQYRGEHSFKAWVFRIATNEALRLTGQRHEDTMSTDGVFSIQADSYVDYGDLEAVRLQKAILCLPAWLAGIPARDTVTNCRMRSPCRGCRVISSRCQDELPSGLGGKITKYMQKTTKI